MAAAKAACSHLYLSVSVRFFFLNLLFSLTKVPNLLLFLYRKYTDEMLLLYAANMDDEDILLVDSLC